MKTIFSELEQFTIDLEREAYEVGAGLKDEANFSAIFERADKLISQETIHEIRDADIEPAERSEYLSFLLCMIIDKALKEPTDAVITKELEAAAEIDGESVSYRMLPVMIANEPDHARRAALDVVRRDILTDQLIPLSRDIMTETHRLVSSFGYANYCDFFEKLEGIPLAPLRVETEKLLRETESFYLSELEYYARTVLKLPLSELAQYDFAYMRRADKFDALFPADKLLPAAWATMNAMGIEAEKHPHVRLDIEKREKKSPRAFCCPVRVPYEVYLVIMPTGGVDDYSSFLHELGHTLHYAHTEASLSLAARQFGDNSVTEAHAGTLEKMIYNKTWLGERLGVSDADASEYLRFMEFFELYMLRRYCAKFHYEMELHGGGVSLDACPDLYVKYLTEATRVQYYPESYLQDLDSHFYCVRYLRSWMLERNIREILESRFGLKWFDDPKAGELLKELWSHGQKHDAETVSAALGAGPLNFDRIIADFVKGK
ncbi:MAG: hypothetical protein WCX65_17180 [bacterium]